VRLTKTCSTGFEATAIDRIPALKDGVLRRAGDTQYDAALDSKVKRNYLQALQAAYERVLVDGFSKFGASATLALVSVAKGREKEGPRLHCLEGREHPMPGG
jgi:hypothetical protein